MSETFSELNINFINSVANFIAFESPYDSSLLNRDLLNQGFILRPIANYGMPNYLRVSIGLESENQKFFSVLKKLVTTQKGRG